MRDCVSVVVTVSIGNANPEMHQQVSEGNGVADIETASKRDGD